MGGFPPSESNTADEKTNGKVEYSLSFLSKPNLFNSFEAFSSNHFQFMFLYKLYLRETLHGAD